MREKVMGLREAVALIQDGDTVAIGGHTLRRHPMALIHELIREGRRELRLQGWNMDSSFTFCSRPNWCFELAWAAALRASWTSLGSSPPLTGRSSCRW